MIEVINDPRFEGLDIKPALMREYESIIDRINDREKRRRALKLILRDYMRRNAPRMITAEGRAQLANELYQITLRLFNDGFRRSK
jgi:aminoglycoside/choline kinase family phosphotransferase